MTFSDAMFTVTVNPHQPYLFLLKGTDIQLTPMQREKVVPAYPMKDPVTAIPSYLTQTDHIIIMSNGSKTSICEPVDLIIICPTDHELIQAPGYKLLPQVRVEEKIYTGYPSIAEGVFGGNTYYGISKARAWINQLSQGWTPPEVPTTQPPFKLSDFKAGGPQQNRYKAQYTIFRHKVLGSLYGASAVIQSFPGITISDIEKLYSKFGLDPPPSLSQIYRSYHRRRPREPDPTPPDITPPTPPVETETVSQEDDMKDPKKFGFSDRKVEQILKEQALLQMTEPVPTTPTEFIQWYFMQESPDKTLVLFIKGRVRKMRKKPSAIVTQLEKGGTLCTEEVAQQIIHLLTQ